MSSQAAKKWLDPKSGMWPLIGITGLTVASMGVWWKRKAAAVPELRSDDSLSAEGGVEQGYGRKTAEAAGLLEGDRPYQGIFNTKRVTDALDGVLPASKEGHPSKDSEVRGGKY
ncbi:hypothetical protein D9Q98_008999 [Chlorella vulgaris]|uniref:Uncharacterized protein n=1 Tax=Chlorella vulgaris TaxID=3077 RepID=A0A9D4TGX7_CHLVU|nr:hypothetical protein D9Q98_008999 [Chlorella vulgaris]